MGIIKLFEKWVSTSTWGPVEPEQEVHFVSKGKIYYGVHDIFISRGSKRIKVKAKFDTGARSSSIDFLVAKKLGISDELIQMCKELEEVKVPKNITKEEQKKLEKKLQKDLKSKFSDITTVRTSKSSSGFSVRAYVRCKLEYNGVIVDTEVNLRDRSGLTCEMLVGLKDMV